jgi:hypothetical protein
MGFMGLRLNRTRYTNNGYAIGYTDVSSRISLTRKGHIINKRKTVFSGKTGFLALGTSALGIILYLLALRCHQLFPGESGQYVGYGKASYSRSLSIDKKEWSLVFRCLFRSLITHGRRSSFLPLPLVNFHRWGRQVIQAQHRENRTTAR